MLLYNKKKTFHGTFMPNFLKYLAVKILWIQQIRHIILIIKIKPLQFYLNENMEFLINTLIN